MADTSVKFCKSCGHNVRSDARYCAKCGANLVASGRPGHSFIRKHRARIILGTLGILIGAFFLLLAYGQVQVIQLGAGPEPSVPNVPDVPRYDIGEAFSKPTQITADNQGFIVPANATIRFWVNYASMSSLGAFWKGDGNIYLYQNATASPIDQISNAPGSGKSGGWGDELREQNTEMKSFEPYLYGSIYVPNAPLHTWITGKASSVITYPVPSGSGRSSTGLLEHYFKDETLLVGRTFSFYTVTQEEFDAFSQHELWVRGHSTATFGATAFFAILGTLFVGAGVYELYPLYKQRNT